MEKKIIKFLRYYITCILDVIYGSNDKCVICGEYCDNSILCNKCNKEIKYFPIDGLINQEGLKIQYYSPVYYSGIIKELIIRLKYKSDFESGILLTKLMKKLIIEKNLLFDIVTFVPIDKRGKKRRGFNQSKFLAQEISHSFDKRLVESLIKIKRTKDQIGLSGEMRWDNLKEGFKVINKKDIKGKKILLIDDVITTGATAFYCCKVLSDSGCKQVIILTAAKSNV